MFRQYSQVNDRTLNEQLRRYVSSGQNDLAVVAMAEKLDRMSKTVEELNGRINAQQEEIDSLRKAQDKPAAKKQTKKTAQSKTEADSDTAEAQQKTE